MIIIKWFESWAIALTTNTHAHTHPQTDITENIYHCRYVRITLSLHQRYPTPPRTIDFFGGQERSQVKDKKVEVRFGPNCDLLTAEEADRFMPLARWLTDVVRYHCIKIGSFVLVSLRYARWRICPSALHW